MKDSSQSSEMASQTQPKLLQTNQPNKSFFNIKILVVEEDPTCLAIVTELLKQYNSFQGDKMLKFTVTAFKSPLEALTVLQKNEFDLVLMNLDMHEMEGKNFMQVTREIQLPIIVMSADENEVKTLEDGVALYLMKPIKKDDLKNLWKYAYTTKTNEAKLTIVDHEEDTISASSVNNIKSTHDLAKNTAHNKKKLGKRRSKEDDGEEEEEGHSRKKAKVVWTASLHNQFLDAVNHFGLDKAYPKRILEFMRVPWLTREHVASHLQKYRLFLKKVSKEDLTSPTKVSPKGVSSNFFNLFSLYKRMKPEDFEMIKQRRRRSPLSQYPYTSSNFATLRYPNDLHRFQDAPAYNNPRTATLLNYCDNYNRIASCDTRVHMTGGNLYPDLNHNFSMNHEVSRASKSTFNGSTASLLSNHFNGGDVRSRNIRSSEYNSSMQLPSFSTNLLPQLSVDRDMNSEWPHSSRQVNIIESSSGRIDNTPNINMKSSLSASNIVNGDATLCDSMFNYQEYDNSAFPPSNQVIMDGVTKFTSPLENSPSNNGEINNIINEFPQANLSSEPFTAAYKVQDSNEHVNPNNFGGNSNFANDQGGKDIMGLGRDESSHMEILLTSKDTDWADEFVQSLLGDDWETG